MSREEIEQVEKELDEVLEIVQRPVPVKNTGREETVSLQENLQENDPLQEEMQIEGADGSFRRRTGSGG